MVFNVIGFVCVICCLDCVCFLGIFIIYYFGVCIGWNIWRIMWVFDFDFCFLDNLIVGGAGIRALTASFETLEGVSWASLYVIDDV